MTTILQPGECTQIGQEKQQLVFRVIYHPMPRYDILHYLKSYVIRVQKIRQDLINDVCFETVF